MRRFAPHAGVAPRLNSVTVRTVGSEPRRGSLSDRILIAVKPVRRSFRFNRVIGTQKRGRHCSGAGRRLIVPPFTRPDTWPKAPVSRVEWALLHVRTFIAAEHPSQLR